MFEIIPLPDSILHAQCLIQSTTPLLAGAAREGVIDISALHFCERPDVAARFGRVLGVEIAPIEGARFEWEAVRDESGGAPRQGEVRLIRVRVGNESSGPLSFSIAVTLAGFAVAPGVSRSATPPVLPSGGGSPSWTNTDVRAATLVGVDLRQSWRVVTSGGSGGATPTGNPTADSYSKTECDGLFRRQNVAVSFSDLSGKPNTLADYGITDALSQAAFAQFVGASTPAALDTIYELVAQLQNDESAVGALATAIAGKEAAILGAEAEKFWDGTKTFRALVATDLPEHKHSSISNLNGSVSVQDNGNVISERTQDFPNHESTFYAGFRSASGVRWGINIGGSRNTGNYKGIEVSFPNTEVVSWLDSYKFQFFGRIIFPDGIRASNHQDLLLGTAGQEPLGVRMYDINSGKTRAYFSGGVVIGYDDVFTAATTLTGSHYEVRFNTSASSIVQPLPDAKEHRGREYLLIKESGDANTLTVAPMNGQGTGAVLSALDSSVTYRSSDGRWRMTARI